MPIHGSNIFRASKHHITILETFPSSGKPLCPLAVPHCLAPAFLPQPHTVPSILLSPLWCACSEHCRYQCMRSMLMFSHRACIIYFWFPALPFSIVFLSFIPCSSTVISTSFLCIAKYYPWNGHATVYLYILELKELLQHLHTRFCVYICFHFSRNC